MVYGYMRLDTVISGTKPWDSLLQQLPKETKTTYTWITLQVKNQKFLYKKILK